MSGGKSCSGTNASNLRQMTAAGLGLLTFLWQLLDRNIDKRDALLIHLRLAGQTLLLITSLYAGVWIAFYATPLAAVGWTAFTNMLANFSSFLRDLGQGLRELLADGWRWIPFALLGFPLLIYTATLFVLMPLAVPILAVRVWLRGLRVVSGRYGLAWGIGLASAVLILWGVLLVVTNRQPQQRAFALLENRPASLAEAEALLAEMEAIRAGLLNAYLAPFRYFSAVGEVVHISDIYEDVFDLPPERAARVQQLYELVAHPVLYTPVNPPESEPGQGRDNWVFQAEPQQAAELYATFFDRSIIEGEREAIVRAARSTWSVDQAQAAWRAVDDREIYLVRQEISATEQGDWAEIELYEQYQNQTTQRQEVVYYFSLPESAVITGVWLGNSPDREARFAYRVAPRGAAQALYRSEVRYNRDPALVEQLGPRQYRLRIFPIEPQRRLWADSSDRSTLEEGPPLHLWLTWRVLAQGNSWPLPWLAEKRNVYWDRDSVRLVNGQNMAAGETTWLPDAIPIREPVEALARRVDFPNGQTVLIRPAGAADLPELPDHARLAVVLDRSRSMAGYAGEVETALALLGELAETGALVDVYLTASPYRGEAPQVLPLAVVAPAEILYYGGQNAAELLAQFEALRQGRSYEAILVLTDGSGYQLGQSEVEVPRPDAPVWMVHLGGDFPPGYDDDTLEAIQASGGGVAGGIKEALNRLAVALAAQPQAAGLDLIDGSTWLTLPAGEADALNDQAVARVPPNDPFAAMAARRLILTEMARRRANLDQPETLDEIHAIAVEQGIVTPYSSMIVLVNQEQEQRLNRLEKEADRFEREYEEVGETAPDLSVTGVPEPEEWLLLALAAGLLVWYARGRLRLRSVKIQ